MSRDYTELLYVAATPTAGGPFAFALEIDGPGGRASIPVAPDVLLSYPAVQQVILHATGYLFRHLMCEGRPPEARDENWGHLCQLLIHHAPATAAGPPN